MSENDTIGFGGSGGQYEPPPGPPEPRKTHRVRIWVRILVACLTGLIALIAGIAVGSGHKAAKTPVVLPVTATSATAPTVTDPNGQACVSLDVTGYCPGDNPAPTPALATTAPAAPAMTGGQQQAVDSAQQYLSDGQGFSYKGLLQQLTSSAGEGFSQADATFAINHLHPDWNAQAVESAKGYLQDGQGFSRSALIDQLTSPYGEAFTQAQAEYAVNKVMG